MGRKGQCWDNAVAESFFASLKGELIDTRAWPTRAGSLPGGRGVHRLVQRHPAAQHPGIPQPRRLRKQPPRKDQECSLTELSALSVKAGQPQLVGRYGYMREYAMGQA